MRQSPTQIMRASYTSTQLYILSGPLGPSQSTARRDNIFDYVSSL